MKAIVSVLALIALLLGWMSYEQHKNLNFYVAENANLKAKLAGKDASELQTQKLACADRAHAVFGQMGYSDKGDAGKSGIDSQTYTNHYNPDLKRCIMELTITGWTGSAEVIQRSIFDADERIDFGDYSWVSSTTKKFYEQKPMQCKMTPPGKEEAYCHSTDEWDAYVKSLMN